MNALGLRFGTVDDAYFEELRTAGPAYAHVGSTLDATVTFADRHEDSTVLGTGLDTFTAARSALRTWVPQRAVGARISPSDATPDEGETVVLALGIGRARLLVPNRIVAVVDELDRYGYAYGTLPGHPERGEELFLVERGDGTVTFTIRVDAEPAPSLRRVGPVVRPLQRLALGRYLASVTRATAGS